jgi:hypothetical protein
VVLVQQIRVGCQSPEVVFDAEQRDPVVGHDIVEVAEEIVFGHRREVRKPLGGEPVEVCGGQPLSIPGRPLSCEFEKCGEAAVALGPDLLGRPIESCNMGR